ncbi:MAG: ribonuclease III [Bdellovibrionales bacterium]
MIAKLELATLEEQLGHHFARSDLLCVALTHRSYHFENKTESLGHFERLEFLGDAVLDLILSEALMRRFPDVDEGTLSKWRASLVNETTLSEIARDLGLVSYLFLGRSEDAQRASARPRLLASAFEAVLAAIYQDGGLECVRGIVERLFASRLDRLDASQEYTTDYKTRLQEWVQKRHRTTPVYRLLTTDGPEHAKTFCYEALVADQTLGKGEGRSRKSAEQDAARDALDKIARGEWK